MNKKLPKFPRIPCVAKALREIKRSGIRDEYRAFEEDDIPGIMITLGANGDDSTDWVIQTGDNSYSGCAYGYLYWGVGGLYRRSNCLELARELIDEIADQWWQGIPD